MRKFEGWLRLRSLRYGKIYSTCSKTLCIAFNSLSHHYLCKITQTWIKKCRLQSQLSTENNWLGYGSNETKYKHTSHFIYITCVYCVILRVQQSQETIIYYLPSTTTVHHKCIVNNSWRSNRTLTRLMQFSTSRTFLSFFHRWPNSHWLSLTEYCWFLHCSKNSAVVLLKNYSKLYRFPKNQKNNIKRHFKFSSKSIPYVTFLLREYLIEYLIGA